MKKLVVLFVAALLGHSTWALNVAKCTCELLENPLAVNVVAPRFGWVLESSVNGDKQTAYEIVVGSSPSNIDKNIGDVWQTGKVKSGQSQFVKYGGAPLKSAHRYYWKVRTWDVKGNVSKWSKTARFDIGLLAPADWGAQWIGAIRRENAHLPEGRNFHKWGIPKSQRALWDSVVPFAKRSIMVRKEFTVDKQMHRAMAYVSGLGHYELSINGSKVGNSEFAPLWTDYDKTVYYNAYDLTQVLKQGPNALGVLLGNGMYNVTGNRYVKFWGSFGPPTVKLRLVIEYKDGSRSVVVTDPSWKYAESPITFNCIFGGEDYDANLEQAGWDLVAFDDKTWSSVTEMEGPQGSLVAQMAPAVGVQESFGVKRVVNAVPGRLLFDMGQNLSGFPAIRVRGKKGQVVKLWVGELTEDDTLVNQKQTGSPHYYQYTLKGTGEETWRPRFSYYGYQYVQVDGANYNGCLQQDGLPQLIELKSCFVYSSAQRHGSFSSSNELFNQTHRLIDRAVCSNMQSVFTDCPHREKLGWLEENHLVGPGIIFNYDVANLLAKTQQDMMDAQLENGLVPSIAPEYTQFTGAFRDSPEWGGAIIINPWMLYEYYGDAAPIVNSYDAMRRYFAYLITMADNGILSHGLGDWYDFGEHRAGAAMNTPIALSATSYFYHMARLMEKSAGMVGKPDDVRFYAQWSKTIRKAFNDKFFNAETKQYATGSQVSNAMALYMGLVDGADKNAVLANLVADIRAHGNRLTSGDIGNRYLFQTLADNDLNDVMYQMNNHYDVPGYGFQIKMGVTTLTENWDPRKGASWNHFMMGQIEEWFFRSLAGIKTDMAQPGFKHFVVEPAMVGDMKWVSASTQTLYGTLNVKWELEGKSASLKVSVPVNTTATLVLKGVDPETATINGRSVWTAKGVSAEKQGDKILVTVDSGEFVLFGTRKS